MKTAKILSFTTLVAMAIGAGSVSLAEEVKDSTTSTEIVSVEGSDLRNDDALSVAVGDFDDVEFLLSAEGMEAIADNVYISFNGVSTQGGEGSGSSMFFSGEASEQVEATQSASTSFNGALTLASKTNTSDAVTTGVGAVAMSMSSDDSTEQYATGAGKSYYEQVSISNSWAAITTYSTTSFLGNSNSVGDGNGGYGISTIDSGIVPYPSITPTPTPTTGNTWEGDVGEYIHHDDGGKERAIHPWSSDGNWSNGEWVDYDDAVFDATGAANSTTVTVDTDIIAYDLTVCGGTDYTFEYVSPTGDGTSLTVWGTVTITDGSSLMIMGGTTTFEEGTYTCVGYEGSGSLIITMDTITGEDPVVTVSSSIVYVGYDGNGTIDIDGGTNTFSGESLYIAYGTGGSAHPLANGGETITEVGSTITIWGGDNKFSYTTTYVGYDGNGTIEIKDGTNTFSGVMYVGYNSTSTGKITISDGTNTFSGHLYIGYSGTGEMTITGGSTTLKGATTIASGSELSVSGGTLTIEKQIGTSTTGSVTFSDSGKLIVTQTLLSTAVRFGDGEKAAVAVITANTITFGSNAFEYDDSSDSGDVTDLVSSYINVQSGAYRVIEWYYYADTGTLYAIVILPEPSMFGVFAGFGALGLIATRRRRRKAAQPNTSRAPLGLRNRPRPASGL